MSEKEKLLQHLRNLEAAWKVARLTHAEHTACAESHQKLLEYLLRPEVEQPAKGDN